LNTKENHKTGHCGPSTRNDNKEGLSPSLEAPGLHINSSWIGNDTDYKITYCGGLTDSQTNVYPNNVYGYGQLDVSVASWYSK
jgi:hypothetical protein